MPHRHRVLVAEDDQGVRELLRNLLTSLNYDVEIARNGVEALGRISTAPPDAIVLDINMPELDGFGVLEAMRSQGLVIPVLLLTARHAADDIRRAVNLGAKDYLTKPFTEAQLKARVARLLGPRPMFDTYPGLQPEPVVEALGYECGDPLGALGGPN